MTISEAGKKYGLSADTLRYYEKIGLIKPRRKPSGIRDYGEGDGKTIEFVMCMRAAGLSIAFLKEYLQLYEKGDATIPERKKLLEDQRRALSEKMGEMRETLARLDYKIEHYGKYASLGKKRGSGK